MNNNTAADITLSLTIPAYNEAPLIVSTLDEVRAWMAGHLPDVSYEIVVTDDGSTDRTGALLDEQASLHPNVRVVHHGVNRGIGQAIRTGLEAARGEYVICLDADLDYSPEHIRPLLEPLRRDEADITLASAYHPKGTSSNVPFLRAVLSRWGNRVLSAGLRGRLHTVTCGVRGYRRSALSQLELISPDKDLLLEIVQKAELLGLRMKEVPAHLHWRVRERRRVPQKKSRLNLTLLNLSGTIISHLVYNYLLRPGSVLRIPLIGLMAACVIGVILILSAWIRRIASTDGPLSLRIIYDTLRDTLINGSLTLAIVVSSAIITMIFLAFYFASQQIKKNFEETYVLLSRMNARLKDVEKMIKK